jgi:Tfp pilus assembly protein PilE
VIIGVLAAIAIPSFLGQSTANGAPSKSLLHTAVLTAETVALDNDNAAITKKLLQTYEPSIATAQGDGPWVSAASGTAAEYTLTVTSAISGNKFTITRNDDGTMTRTCTIPTKTSPPAGCNIVKNKNGTW